MSQTVAQTSARTPFERIGGHAALRAITDRFYDLMEQDPAYAELRAIHADDLAPMRESLPLFLAGWAGGPRDWFEAHPGQCMMSMHAPFPIGRQTADQWAEAMSRAIAETELADREMGDAMAEVLGRMARNMARNMARD
ncbi:MAG: group II truncated hemoglobin [Novosphingobium sp.]